MSPAPPAASPPQPGSHHVAPTGRRRMVRALTALAIVAVSAAMGWGAGHLWWQWWSPAPAGVVYETPTGLRWLADPVDAGSAHLFAATGEYAVIGVGLGLLLGVCVGLLTRGWEVVGLLVGLLAAGVAAYAMVAVGTDLSPPDPQGRVDEVGEGATLPGAMEVGGWTPYLAWPGGMLAGHLAAILLLPRHPRTASRGSVG